jgi:hypothetical protein
VHPGPVAGWGERGGRSPAGLSAWQQALLLRGMDRWGDGPRGGHRPQLAPRQQPRLVERSEAGPRVVGGETAGGTAVRIRVRLWRECGGLSHGPSVGTWRPNLGWSCHKARLMAEHLDAAQRLAWLLAQGPALGRAAKRCQGWSLWAEEARFAQGGREVPRGPAAAAHPQSRPVASAKAPRGVGRWPMSPGGGACRASRAGCTRPVTTRSCSGAEPKPRRPCV